ncbi:hypothetical protein [Bacillus sp. Bva_UNVM-123]
MDKYSDWMKSTSQTKSQPQQMTKNKKGCGCGKKTKKTSNWRPE